MSTVLLVQSDSRLEGAFRAALAAEFAVLFVDNVDDGIACAREGGLDAIVVDGVSVAALERLVAALGRLPDAPPFFLLSAHPSAPSISARLGAAAFVPSPCSPRDLGAMLRERLLG